MQDTFVTVPKGITHTTTGLIEKPNVRTPGNSRIILLISYRQIASISPMLNRFT